VAAVEHDSGLANSFTDLMTSLMVIFILLLCASLNNAKIGSGATVGTILEELSEKLKEFRATGVRVERDPKDPLGLLILVLEGLLAFEVDKAAIPPQGEHFLQSFIPKLSNTLCDTKFAKEINSIVVEGHTDSTGTDQHNLELSQKRSMTVVSSSLGVLSPPEWDREYALFLRLLSASGRGRAELEIDSSGREDRSRSRRVVFKIRVRSAEQKDFKEMLGVHNQ
jgi:outer membrane protein OmpA-like peptidoglycan-associated protein